MERLVLETAIGPVLALPLGKLNAARCRAAAAVAAAVAAENEGSQGSSGKPRKAPQASPKTPVRACNEGGLEQVFQSLPNVARINHGWAVLKKRGTAQPDSQYKNTEGRETRT